MTRTNNLTSVREPFVATKGNLADAWEPRREREAADGEHCIECGKKVFPHFRKYCNDHEYLSVMTKKELEAGRR